ncbi:MAG: hypothetical protein JWO35_437 [Candidatus Saccharibacteria bacterium]|nr:hypothetical protein [Candidatus Saccharibacteria bacterium]
MQIERPDLNNYEQNLIIERRLREKREDRTYRSLGALCFAIPGVALGVEAISALSQHHEADAAGYGAAALVTAVIASRILPKAS